MPVQTTIALIPVTPKLVQLKVTLPSLTFDSQDNVPATVSTFMWRGWYGLITSCSSSRTYLISACEVNVNGLVMTIYADAVAGPPLAVTRDTCAIQFTPPFTGSYRIVVDTLACGDDNTIDFVLTVKLLPGRKFVEISLKSQVSVTTGSAITSGYVTSSIMSSSESVSTQSVTTMVSVRTSGLVTSRSLTTGVVTTLLTTVEDNKSGNQKKKIDKRQKRRKRQ